MADNKEIGEIYKQHQSGEDKYKYFLLATSAAAIGFAVQKTDGLKLSWFLLPVAIAIVSWGVSFYFGCKNISWVQTAILANFNLLQLMAGVNEKQPSHPQLAQAAVSGVENALDKNIDKAQFYGIGQFQMLVFGAICFIGWRVVEMVRLTYGD